MGLSSEEIQLAKEFKVSKNFTLFEAINSSSYPELVEWPSDAVIKHIIEFYETVVQPIRDKFGKIQINSGYRCPPLNKKVGGVGNSIHQIMTDDDKFMGVASDIVPLEAGLVEVFDWAFANIPEVKTAIIYRRPSVTRTPFIHLDTSVSRKNRAKMEKVAPSAYVNYVG